MKILITGANGQLGRSMQRVGRHDFVPASHAQLDVTSLGACIDAVEAHRPHAVVHCAAMTDTARCEKEPARAREVNGIGTENVARASARVGARLIAVSTNEVFDGAQSSPYEENDAPHPLNAYGHSKLDGEALSLARYADTAIVRTSWLYGAGYVNFNEKVLSAVAEHRPLSFVTDEVAAPTSTDDLAHGMIALLEREAAPGVYHLANEGAASRHEWTREILRLSGQEDTPVAALTTAELRARGYSGPQKPPYSVLANTRAAALGVRLRDWRDALAEYFARRAP